MFDFQVPLDICVTHHQVALKLTNPNFLEEATNIFNRSKIDQSEMKKEIESMYTFFSQFGEIVDLNLDFYLKGFIPITYRKHSSVLKLLGMDSLSYKTAELQPHSWTFTAYKMDFRLPVRNFRADESRESKFMPRELKEQSL